MNNIIKSLCYDAVKSKGLIRLVIFIMLLMGLITVLNINLAGELPGTSGMLVSNPDITYLMGFLFTGILIAMISGDGFADKTSNYEVMSGHSRKSIIIARGLFGAVVTALVLTAASFIPIIVGNIFFDWGDSLRLSDVIIRQLLYFFPLLRISAFTVSMLYIIRNQYITMILGYGLIMFVNMVDHINKSYYSAVSNLELLTDYKGWSIYNLDPVDGIVEYSAYDSSIDPKMVFGTIAVSLVMAAFYLILAYAVFRREDID